jgi:hypothetical protein
MATAAATPKLKGSSMLLTLPAIKLTTHLTTRVLRPQPTGKLPSIRLMSRFAVFCPVGAR